MDPDRFVLAFLAALLVLAASLRRDYLGDGVRHLNAAFAGGFHFGEPRWLLFPPLARALVGAARWLGFASDSESALRALLWACVAAGIVVLFSLGVWLRAECDDRARVAASLLLAGSCAPFVMLFSDIAEPQIASAIVVLALAYARVRRDDQSRAPVAALVAVIAIGAAAAIYQGMILALGMLPLVVSSALLKTRRVLTAVSCAILLVAAAMIAAQMADGSTLERAAATTIAGEQNPLARSLMASASPVKYLIALVAGPPQGLVAVDRFSGLRALWTALMASDPSSAWAGVSNACRLLLGFVVTAALVWKGARARQWRVLVAAGVLLVLPVLRNEQYGYPKFFVLWPIPLALLALRWPARTTGIVAATVLAANTWLLARTIAQGREAHDAAAAAYVRATPSTCWMTTGWAPPFHYLWPGTTANMLGTLATGSDPSRQASRLHQSLLSCFCESDAVWTDATIRDAAPVRMLAAHFGVNDMQLPAFLLDPAQSRTAGPARIYSRDAQQRACRLAQTRRQ